MSSKEAVKAKFLKEVNRLEALVMMDENIIAETAAMYQENSPEIKELYEYLIEAVLKGENL